MTFEETPSQLYRYLHDALGLPRVRDTYREYGRVLRLAADQPTQFAALHLGSLYAKVDYLAKQKAMPARLVRIVNDARVRLRRLLAIDDAELAACRLYDLKAIALFIQAVYDERVPVELALLFPDDERRAADGSVVADRMRIGVTRWDDTCLYGHCEELPDDEEVRVCYRQAGEGGDWTYLKRFLADGVQLNVVRPRLMEGTYYPELLVLEPDYLVDVTTIAGCFEPYAHDPLLAIVQRLMPREESEATLLGGLAGQLLDEEVHRADDGNTTDDAATYETSYTRWMRGNLFKTLVTDTDNLHDEGLRQRDHIRRALSEGLEQRVGRYRREEVMLEPSFFSELLGIQGRMDLLQLDYKVLLEQKSGKGEWVRGARPDDPPRRQLKHYVQVLLYLAILNYNYHMPNREVQALLLYSKYRNGLIGVTAAPALLHEAMRLRNQLVGLELMMQQRGYELLDRLTPAYFRKLDVNDGFWQRIEPRLSAVLDPLGKASATERAYFYRFMRFVAVEHTLAKVGSRRKENSGFAAKWHDTLDEKLEAGNICVALTLTDPDARHRGSVERMTLTGADLSATNFRTGDIVIAYPYQRDMEPDARSEMVFRATIEELREGRITLALRAPQSDKHVMLRWNADEYLWAIEHDLLEASYRPLYAGLHSLLTAPKERRDLLLMQREPVADRGRTLKGSYGTFDEMALRVKQACDYYLIIGPPGTGKTSYGMLYTLKEQLLEAGSQVLVMSYTNRAVDEICSKLIDEGIDFVRMGSARSCAPECRAHLLEQRLEGCPTIEAMRRQVMETRVVVGTTTALCGALQLFRLKRFDLAIIDEASQILEPHLMPLLTATTPTGEPAIAKMVMIGDHKQLPAVVQQDERESATNDPLLTAIGLTDCRLSLFERLLKRHRGNPEVVWMLTHQGRMHREIADFPNRAFYGGRLTVVPLEHQARALPTQIVSTHGIDRLLLTQRVAFVAVGRRFEEFEGFEGSDKVNREEARMIAATVERIYRLTGTAFDAARTVGVIVPYRNQIAAIRHEIEAYGHPELADITIDTVERYQGSQRDYILYGFTVQRRYQLTFLTGNTFEEDGCLIDRKLNVAMTRAREHLLMFGNPTVIGEAPVFSDLMEYMKAHNYWVETGAEAYIEGKF